MFACRMAGTVALAVMLCPCAAAQYPSVIEIGLDVRPGSISNPVNLGACGSLPVAVLAAPDFSPDELDLRSLRLVGAPPETAGNGKVKTSRIDANRDGLRDLLLHFPIARLQLASDAAAVELTGRTQAGLMVHGVDSVRVVGPGSGAGSGARVVHEVAASPTVGSPAETVGHAGQPHLPQVTEHQLVIYDELPEVSDDEFRVRAAEGEGVAYDLSTGEETTLLRGDVSRCPSQSELEIDGGAGARSGWPAWPPVDPAEHHSFGSLRRASDSHDLTEFPWSATVKLWFNFPGDEYLDLDGDGVPESRGSRICSGALIDPLHVLTAGHCVHNRDKGGWAEWIEVRPAYESYNEQQIVWIEEGSWGRIRLSVLGEWSGEIEVRASSDEVEEALESAATVNDVDVSGDGVEDDPWVITFLDPGRRDIPEVAIDDTYLRGPTGDGRAYATTIVEGGPVSPFGRARAVALLSWSGWIRDKSFQHDVGVIALDRPLGALTGWFGRGYNEWCPFYRERETFRHTGYPGDGPYDGEVMHTRSGDYDICVWNWNLLKYWNRSFHGQSGSPSFTTSYSVHAVLSNIWNVDPEFTRDARLTPGKLGDIGDFIADHMPVSPDLLVLDVQATPTSIEAGDVVDTMSFVVHNTSTGEWDGAIEAFFFLSDDAVVAGDDTPLFTGDGVYSGVALDATLCPRCSALVTLPTALLPRIPLDTPEGNHWLGMVLSPVDSDPANNGTSGYDSQLLEVLGPEPPAAPTDLHIVARSATHMALEWTDNADDEDGFRLERRRTGDTEPELSVWLLADTTSYPDFGLEPATLYCYRLTACRTATGCSSAASVCGETSDVPPAPPGSLIATASWPSGNELPQIDLSWHDNSDNEDGFYVWRALGGGGAWVRHATVARGSSAFVDEGLPPETAFCYRVTAFNEAGESSPSNSDCKWTPWGPPPTEVPAAPSDLVASPGGNHIDVTWHDNSDNEDSFVLERRLSTDTAWTVIVTPGRNATAYTDTTQSGLVEGLTYCYRIKARNTVGDSDYSNEDCTTLTPAPLSTPTGFSVVTGAPGELELAWEDNSDQEDGYEIERAAPGAAFEQIAEVPPDAESFVDSALSSGATFCYRVRAFRVLTVGAGREYSGYAGPACEMVP